MEKHNQISICKKYGSDLDDSLFEVNKTRPKLTQKQKHENCQRHKGVPEHLSSLTDIHIKGAVMNPSES